MIKTAVLLVLAALSLGACTGTNESSGVVKRAATCAMCGASVTSDYLFYSSEKDSGPDTSGAGGGW